MIYLISPSKKMIFYKSIVTNVKINEYTAELLENIKSLSIEELKKILFVNDLIAQETFDSFYRFSDSKASMAIFSYVGEQFKAIDASSFSRDEFEFLDSHVRIISAFYGLVKPGSYIKRYRLPMETKIINHQSLDVFWRDYMIEKLQNEQIINLSSDEYCKALDKNVINYKNIIFQEKRNECFRIVKNIKEVRGKYIKEIVKNKIDNLDALMNMPFLDFKCMGQDKNNIIYQRE